MNTVLRRLGVLTGTFGVVFLLLVAAAPIGLVDPYPMPPSADVAGPLGATKDIDVQSLYKKNDEKLGEYLSRLTKDIASGIVHYWHEGDKWETPDTQYTRPSIWDNYLLWLHPLISGYEHFYRYEFISPEKAINRGYGFCSQVARIVWSILHRQRIDAEILSNPNHVVVQSIGNILDPDFGVFIPMTWQEIQSGDTAAIVKQYYREFESSQPLLTKAYSEGWQSSGLNDPSIVYMLAYEEKMDRLKWFPPIIAISFGALLLLLSRKTER